MTLKMIVSLLVFLSSALAWASSSNVQVMKAPQDIVYEGTSEHNRMDKQYSLNLVALGFGPSVATSSGVNAGLFLDRNNLLELEYVSGRPLTIDWGNSYDHLDSKTSSFGVHLKHFAGNSFYVRGGLDYRMADYDYTYNYSSTDKGESKFNGDSIAATVIIGNQWQWQNFTLGCDWIGVALPITSQVKSESVVGDKPYYFEKDKDTLLKKTATVLLRLYAGASF